MELIDHDRNFWKSGSNSITIWIPHVHRHALDVASVFHALNKLDDRLFGTVVLDFDDTAFLYVNEYPAVVLLQVQFINAEDFRCDDLVLLIQLFGFFLEQGADSGNGDSVFIR